MVSKAREDLPDPETPVTTVSWLWEISKSIFFKLWTRAPRTMMLSFDIVTRCSQTGRRNFRESTEGFRRAAESFYYTRWRARGGRRSASIGLGHIESFSQRFQNLLALRFFQEIRRERFVPRLRPPAY